MKNIATDLSSLDELVNARCVYVDKTAYLHRLITSASKLYFISRPRRFGKSLMLSTLKAIFEARKELLKGLDITKTDYDWKKHPVMHLDMSSARASTIEDIAVGLNNMVVCVAKQLDIAIVKENSPAQTFENLWNEIHKKNLQVVVLVDEYDILAQGFLGDREKLDEISQLMHDFYIRLKAYASNIRFMMMTGVTKLAKLSIFSGLNNLIDLSMSPEYAGLLGYTHEEVKTFFADHIKAFAEKEKTTEESIFAKLLEWYDNYRFSPDVDVKVLNPVSVGFSLANKKFDRYWNSTGAATLVIEALKRSDRWPSDLNDVSVSKENLDVCLAEEMPAIPLLYQGGYLTIKSAREDVLKLCIPNAEVQGAIVSGHIESLFDSSRSMEFSTSSKEARLALEDGKLDEALQIFRSSMARLPYEWLVKDEGSVKVAFLDFFYAMRKSKVNCERQVANGRVDAIIETTDTVYIFEFKYGKSAKQALEQIVDMKYYEPYLASGKRIVGVGLNWNTRKKIRGIDEPLVGEIKSATVNLPSTSK